MNLRTIPPGSIPGLERNERERRGGYCVYFIRADRGGPIKIGLTHRLTERLAALQMGCPFPLAVIAIIEGGAGTTEAGLHNRFAAGRLHGEWFDPDTPGLLELVGDALRDDLPDYVKAWVRLDTRIPTNDPWCEHENHRRANRNVGSRPVYRCEDCRAYFYYPEEAALPGEAAIPAPPNTFSGGHAGVARGTAAQLNRRRQGEAR